MLIALTYLGTQWSLNAIADKFGVSESTVHVTIRRVLDFLLSINEREIRWPNDEEAARKSVRFARLLVVTASRLACQTSSVPLMDAMFASQEPQSARRTTTTGRSSTPSSSRLFVMPTWCSLTYSLASQAQNRTPGCWRKFSIRRGSVEVRR
ncbi:hypothetical protein MRX96_053402 [Rhipicephalus microplus]